MVERIINFIKALLSDNGIISSVRFMSVMTVTTIMLTWSYLCIKNNLLLEPVMVFGIIVALITGKVYQFKLENNEKKK